MALGLVNYYYTDKQALIASALRRIEANDIEIVEADAARPAPDRLRAALRRVADPEFLTTDYLSLRLQLWSLAQAHPKYAEINAGAQQRYRAGLADLIREAVPEVDFTEAGRRVADIDVIQNGIWLTALLGLDQASMRRAVDRCEAHRVGFRPGAIVTGPGCKA